MEEIWNLRNVHLFQGLAPAQMDEVLKTMPVASYRKNEFVFMAGDVADSIYVVQVGMVKVSYIDMSGEEKILNIFQSGDIFGNLFLGKYRQRIGNAQALGDVNGRGAFTHSSRKTCASACTSARYFVANGCSIWIRYFQWNSI